MGIDGFRVGMKGFRVGTAGLGGSGVIVLGAGGASVVAVSGDFGTTGKVFFGVTGGRTVVILL